MPNGVYTGGGAIVVMDTAPVAYAKMFYDGSGPDRYLRKLAESVAIRARKNAPRRSGLLAASIRFNQNRDERGRYAFGYSVVAAASYSGYVHEGTDPSVRVPGTIMHFQGTNRFAGKEQFTRVVHHPGTPAQPFLRDALVAMVGG